MEPQVVITCLKRKLLFVVKGNFQKKWVTQLPIYQVISFFFNYLGISVINGQFSIRLRNFIQIYFGGKYPMINAFIKYFVDGFHLYYI